MRHHLLIGDGKSSQHLNSVFDVSVGHFTFSAGTLNKAGLIVQLVIDLWACHNDVTKHIELQIWVVMFSNVIHVLDLANNAHYSKIEELEVRIIGKVTRFQVFVRNRYVRHADKLAVQPVE